MFKNHPPGLKVLFFTEMWERFAYYLMVGIFLLYLKDPVSNGGMGFSEAGAAEAYGWFIALVYLTPFFGGMLADRVLGYRRSIFIGGLLMGAGYLGVAFLPGMTPFVVSLGLVVVGNGLFKPNISSIVGRLYAEGSPLRDSGYNLFYMGINIGSFVCNFVAAVLRNRFGWSWAFAAAGIGMLLGVTIFTLGKPALASASDRGDGGAVEQGTLSRILVQIFLPALAAGGIGYAMTGSPNMAFFTALVPIVAYYAIVLVRSTRAERRPLGALLTIFAVATVFWMVYFQNGSTLTLWAEQHTDRRAGAAAPVLEFLQMHQEAPAEYWANVPPAERPPAGTTETLVSTELFQSINPGFIVLMTPLVVWFFAMLRRRGREPNTPTKIASGLFITGGSTLIMVMAVTVTHGGTVRGSPLWLFGTYAVITVGELFLSPMGLSLASKLSPARLTGVMMGGWFLALSLGAKMSGLMGGLYDKVPLKWIFVVNFATVLVAAVATTAMVPWIRRVMTEHEREVATRLAKGPAGAGAATDGTAS